MPRKKKKKLLTGLLLTVPGVAELPSNVGTDSHFVWVWFCSGFGDKSLLSLHEKPNTNRKQYCKKLNTKDF